MPTSTSAAVRTQIASGKTHPVYLLIGEDEEEKSRLAAEFAHVVEEELRAFNVERFYGDETSPGRVIDAARNLPMLATRRIILVLRAERILAPKRENEKATRELEAFEAYVRAPEAHATVVLVASALNRRHRIFTLLAKQATVVEFGGVDDVGEAQRWIRQRVVDAKMQIDPEASRVLARRAGADIGRLRSDVERLLLYTAGQKRIGSDDVLAVTGPAVSQDDWAVARAIEHGAADVALRELALALDAGAVPYMILGQLGWVVRTKLPATRVPDAVGALYRTDLGLKTSVGDPRVLLERLVVELCGGGSAAGRGLR